MKRPGQLSILFVCTGNICRSPSAEAVFRSVAELQSLPVRLDSAGTHDQHTGEAPDRRAIEHARRRGYDLSALRARQVKQSDFEDFDLVLAMDRGHLQFMEQFCVPRHRHKLKLFLDFAGMKEADVPDPYYGGPGGFELVLDLVEAASKGLADHVRMHLSRVST
mgnify:CR=1 FL=1